MSEGGDCWHIVNATVVNRNVISQADVLIYDGRIERIGHNLKVPARIRVFDACGCFLVPGAIDVHVHFREPGMEHKGNIYTESRAALAGGVTTCFDMPNTIPPTTTFHRWQAKMELAQRRSWTNYAFYVALTDNNVDHLLGWVGSMPVAGIKVFLAESTGGLIVREWQTVERAVSESPVPLAFHAEMPWGEPPRPEEACLEATKQVVNLAKKYPAGAPVHILHLSTAQECEYLQVHKPGRVSVETCPHYLFFTRENSRRLSALLKCNPAIKGDDARRNLLKALASGLIDTVGSDHAPHTLPEKLRAFAEAPAGIPSVQLTVLLLWHLVVEGHLFAGRVVDALSHKPAEIFGVMDRGFVEEGCWADLVLVDVRRSTSVEKKLLLFKCGWTPYEGMKLNASIRAVWINGMLAVQEGAFLLRAPTGKAVEFSRPC